MEMVILRRSCFIRCEVNLNSELGLPSKGVSGFGATASGSAKEKIVSDAVGEQLKSLSRNLLVVSGGEGYVDFRLGEKVICCHLYSNLREFVSQIL